MKLLRFNDSITFGAKGNFKDYAAGGWSLGEDNPTVTWTESLEARLQFNAQATTAAVSLRVVGFPYLGNGQLDSQRVWVHLNGMYVGIFNAAADFEQVLPLRSQWLEPRGNVLSFTLPFARSPKALGLGDDQRLLGICLSAVSLNLA